ncbi:hypothetical protein CsSME_00025577 [Camellia sinensis var. sinensis]
MELRRRTLVHRWIKACARNKRLGCPTGGWSETPLTVESVSKFGREKIESTIHSLIEERKDSVEQFCHSRAPHALYLHGVG